ncbi:MAG: DUF5681 domain-containing protein [Terriglobia bacterium]
MIEQPKQGRWQKGTSGNASGRPRGARNKSTLAVESLLGGEAEALTRKVIKMALAGDTTAMKLCMDRIAPVRKDREVTFALRNVETGADISAAMSDILRAVSEGRVTPAESEIISRVLDVKRKAIDSTDHEQRIIEIEKHIEESGGGTK